jgi:4-amino-4-deoxy-L-arabinose transferase-like glycosyltransferase
MKIYLYYFILALIFLLGLFLRSYNLNISPPSLNWDEAAWGYNSYSILKTGRDEYGKFLPIFTRSFDEYKPTFPMYAMLPTIYLFGLNEFGIRLPSAIIGSLLIVLIALITLKLFGSALTSLFAAYFLGIEPWAVHMSRVYYDANEALFFLMLGIYLLLISKTRLTILIMANISLVVSMFTYNANKLLVPLLLLLFFIIYREKIVKIPAKALISIFLLWIVVFGTFLYLTIKGEALARVGSTNILRIWNGNVFDFLINIFSRYLAYFSPPNLFVREPLEPSTVIPNLSLFLPFEFIAWLIGLYLIIKNNLSKLLKLIVIIAPIPASLTWNWFQPGRGLNLFFIFTICIAVGFSEINRLIKNTILKSLFVTTIVLTGLIYAILIFDSEQIQLPARDAGNWQPGFKETVPLVMELETKVNHVVIDTPQGQPYIFYLVYGKYDPIRYHSELDTAKIGIPRTSFNFGKFEFRNITPEDVYLKNTLLVTARERASYFYFSAKDVVYNRNITGIDNREIARIYITKP